MPVTFSARGPIALPSVAPYQGPGDIATGWIAWYGMRAFTLASAGSIPIIRLVRNDAVEVDVYALADGSFDTTTVNSAWLSGHTASIKTWYDQAGSGKHIDTLVTTGDVFTLTATGGRPGIIVNSAKMQQSAALGANYAQPWSASCVAKRNSGGSGGAGIICIGNEILFFTAANNMGFYAEDTAVGVSAADAVFHDMQIVCNTTSSTICLDGVDNSVSAGGGALGLQSTSTIQFPTDAGGSLDGVILEGGFRAGGFTGPERTNLATNQKNWYGYR